MSSSHPVDGGRRTAPAKPQVVEQYAGRTERRLDPPPRSTPYVYLKPITQDDYRFLQLAETTEALGPRWRFRGSTPSPEQWAHGTWSSVLAQFLIVARRNNAPIGLAAVYQASFQDGYASLAAARFEPEKRSPLMVLGIAVFLEYVFSCWDLRKLYMEVPEYNLHQFGSGLGRLFAIEGRLRDHLFAGGRRWDQVVLALYRDVWRERGGSLLLGNRHERDRDEPSRAQAIR